MVGDDDGRCRQRQQRKAKWRSGISGKRLIAGWKGNENCVYTTVSHRLPIYDKDRSRTEIQLISTINTYRTEAKKSH